MSNQGRIMNADGEVLVSGLFDVNEEGREVVFRPISESRMLDRETGPLFLELEDDRVIELSNRFLKFRLASPDGERQSIYRLRYVAGQEARGFPASR